VTRGPIRGQAGLMRVQEEVATTTKRLSQGNLCPLVRLFQTGILMTCGWPSAVER
jgi:hypothetical protein